MKAAPEPGAAADQYSIDHSAGIAVLDPQGRMAGVVSGRVLNAETPQPEAIAADLARLTAESRP